MSNKVRIDAVQLPGIIFLAEWIIIVFSGTSFTGLSGNPLFLLPADPAYMFVFASGLPAYILSHHFLSVLFDIAITGSVVAFIISGCNARWARACFILLFIYYIILTALLGHSNYQQGMFLLFVPFMFRNINRQYAFEATRYFLLFFYVSAAIFKIYYGGIFHIDGFANVLAGQFLPYYAEHNTGWRTGLNQYLVGHTGLAYALYLGGFMLELIAITGFFTKRYDSLLCVAILSFHLVNWILMDIAPIGHLGFICLLLISRKLSLPKQS